MVDRLAELEAIRLVLLERLDSAFGLNLSSSAGLSRELRAVMAEISELSVRGRVSVVDEVGGRRERKAQARTPAVGSRRGKGAK